MSVVIPLCRMTSFVLSVTSSARNGCHADHGIWRRVQLQLLRIGLGCFAGLVMGHFFRRDGAVPRKPSNIILRTVYLMVYTVYHIYPIV